MNNQAIVVHIDIIGRIYVSNNHSYFSFSSNHQDFIFFFIRVFYLKIKDDKNLVLLFRTYLLVVLRVVGKIGHAISLWIKKIKKKKKSIEFCGL